MDFKAALDKLVEQIVAIVRNMLESAPFDKTYTGIVRTNTKPSNSSVYALGVEVDGKKRTIKSVFNVPVNSLVKILVPRNNWDNARIILPDDMTVLKKNGLVQNLSVQWANNKVGRAVMSYQATSTTLNDLINEVRYSNGCIGSCAITGVSPMPTSSTWYNFIWLPHRFGGNYGVASGDNCNYGTLLLFYMTSNTATWFTVHLTNGTIQAPQSHA